MATITRQPFAPLDGARLQTLTSLKNRQNSITTSPKRKAAELVDTDDTENVDPVMFSKRAKGVDSSFISMKGSFTKPAFALTKSVSTGDVTFSAPSKAVAATPRPRSYPNSKSPAKINTGITKSTPLSAPAGRSPTRGKRSGISSRRRAAGPYRIDPPSFGGKSATAAPFSLDAALKGTISSYAGRKTTSSASSSSTSIDFRGLHEPESKATWDFVIHEDTPEQEMTNLLQHGTCVLDISSDEESASRLQRERAEGKENVPPADDISQVSRPRAARQASNENAMEFEKERRPLGEMDAREFYSEGHDESSVVIVPGDGDEESENHQQQPQEAASSGRESVSTSNLDPVAEAAEPESVPDEKVKTVEELMQKTDEPVPCAALLQPVEGTGESFEVWESGSAQDEEEATAASCS